MSPSRTGPCAISDQSIVQQSNGGNCLHLDVPDDGPVRVVQEFNSDLCHVARVARAAEHFGHLRSLHGVILGEHMNRDEIGSVHIDDA